MRMRTSSPDAADVVEPVVERGTASGQVVRKAKWLPESEP
jgi:hypothetical protein